MSDIISRQAAIDALGKIGSVDTYADLDYAIGVFKDLPSVEAVPVVHGRWVKQNPLVDTEECSHCGYNIVSAELETPFCPWCGAAMKMEGAEE